MKLEELEKYDHIRVVSLKTSRKDGSMYSTTVIGQFRGRVVGGDNCSFSEEGKEIWVTADAGFEAFLPIEEILNVSKI